MPALSFGYSNLAAFISGVSNSLGSITINAKATFTITHTFAVPVGYAKQPFFAYISSSGWAGIVCQGIQINMETGSVNFTLFNSLDSQVTTTPTAIALFYK